MAAAATYAKLTPLLREVFDDEALVAEPGLTARKVSGWDSLGNIRLFLQIEQTFSLHFSTNEITALRNVEELADLIEEKSRPQNG